MLVFPAAQIIGASARWTLWIRRVMLVVIVLTAMDIAWQYVVGQSLLLGIKAPIGHSRFAGSLANPNEIAFVALLLPLAVISPAGVRAKFTSIGCIVLACLAALLTGSRATLGGLFVSASTRSWFGTRRFITWSPVALLLLGAAVWVGDFGSFRKRLSETLQPQQEVRWQTWRIAVDAFVDRPLLGNGPAVFFEVNEASRTMPRVDGSATPAGGMPWVHNVPLELLAERGVIGALLFVSLCAFIARDLRRGLACPSTRAWSSAVAASLAAFAAMSLVDLTLLKDWCSICVWLSAGFAATLGARDDAGTQAA